MKKAVFLDKDGTLIKDISYNVNPALVEFEAYAFETLKLLQNKGYCLAIITNQPGVAFGYFTEEDVKKLHMYLKDSLKYQGIALQGFYYCPHHSKGNIPSYTTACNCRKPSPGLLVRAAAEMNIDLNRSWMIGDILNDVEAGNKAGCTTILIDNGNETEWELTEDRKPGYTVKHLMEAAEIIIGSEN